MSRDLAGTNMKGCAHRTRLVELPGEDLTMLVYTAEHGSASQQALDLLASWAATLERERQDREARAPA